MLGEMVEKKNILFKVRFAGRRAHAIFWPIVVAGVVGDLWSKAAIFEWLIGRGGRTFTIVDGFLRLVLAVNDGAAFGIAAGRQGFLVSVSVVALVVVLGVFLFGGSKQRLVNVALGLFTAGICGNLYDRIFNDGLVRDFIDVVYWPGKHWPAFNVADSMLCVAVGLMIISTAVTGRPGREHGQ